MSANENGGDSGDAGPGRREVAHRLFATEFDTASLQYADSNEERAPKYVITPTGARVNRLFVVGVLTEVERVNEDVVRARVVDPTGAFVVYAGQYQPDALAFLERADPPTFVAVTGKANTFRPEDSDRVYTSIRPESIAEVDAETRDRWTVQAAEHTLRRVGEFARALEGETTEDDPTGGIALAREEYGTTPAYLAALRETALEAARLVAGEVEEVTAPAIAPGEDDGRPVDLADLQDRTVETPEPAEIGEPGTDATTADTSEPSPSTESATTEPEPETGAAIESESDLDEVETGGSDVEEGAPEASTADVDGADSADAIETATAKSESGTEGNVDDLGDFDAGGDELSASEPEGGVEADAAADEDELYEFDPEERAEIEAEFDMDFTSGNEVEEPGEADIDVPEPESGGSGETGTADSETTGSGEPAAVTDTDTEDTSEPEPAADEDGSEEGAEDVDVEDRAMAVMQELADGDGADREAVVERVASEAGVDPDTVDDAIESALLSGRCYEPQDDVLKPI